MKAEPPNFRPMLIVAKRIKMALGTEVGLIPGGLVVLDGDPAPPQKGAERPPKFSAPISIVAKRLDAPKFHWLWS